MMGPNCNILLEELIYRYPISKNARILDLGCGRGLSTLFLMEQFPTSKIFQWIYGLLHQRMREDSNCGE